MNTDLTTPGVLLSYNFGESAPGTKTNRSLGRQKTELGRISSIEDKTKKNITKLAINSAMVHMKMPPQSFGHVEVNSKRVFSDLGASVFSVLFECPDMKGNSHIGPELKFLSFIEEFERYVSLISAMPNNENELHEDMRKHKKFLQESIDEEEFLQRFFGIMKISESAILNYGKLRPINLEVDPSGDSF